MIDLFRRGSRRIVRECRQLMRNRWRRGPPPGLDREILARILRTQGYDRLVQLSHQHVSGWKDAGAYRLSLTAANGAHLSLIFKNARVDAHEIPAFQNLPVRPGPSEFYVYRSREGSLSTVTPAVHYRKEVLAGEHYQFVLEDLGPRSRNPVTSDDTIRAATYLARVQDVLDSTLDDDARNSILRYDDEFFDRLLSYTARNLDRYVSVTGDPSALHMRELLSELPTLRRDLNPYSLVPSTTIHGDYNKANIFFSLENESTIHVIDWEWAGIGLPHADLASLLKRDDPELEQVALGRYASHRRASTWEDHLHAYEWCQLERGLLDAGFLAAQQIDPAHAMGWIPPYIANALRRTHRAYKTLQAKSQPLSRSPSDATVQDDFGPDRTPTGAPYGSGR